MTQCKIMEKYMMKVYDIIYDKDKCCIKFAKKFKLKKNT